MKNLQKKTFNIQNYNFKISIFFLLLCSFIFGNLIGIYSKKISYNFFSLFFFNIILELLNFFNYSFFDVLSKQTHKNSIIKKMKIIINIFKRGFLLGIFLEAFKLGS
ncbi:hypothetical protein ACKKBG_P80035 (chloroplast) [Auxenochlorella protothecoides x Auxenochlorella symbiontica]|uniref:Ycf20 n=1 Tax=Auxenochlorella protothecoides TaxID=3075 RepID=A0A023HHL7_AUXPR|nr:hypothetical protein [Auxenochlorella protothecoides]AGL10849.1 hypothetical protein [Auxenochlorella protothecoides]ARU77482.1 hypothetical protein BW920_0002 [Auxenochlorella protothecoides]